MNLTHNSITLVHVEIFIPPIEHYKISMTSQISNEPLQEMSKLFMYFFHRLVNVTNYPTITQAYLCFYASQPLDFWYTISS